MDPSIPQEPGVDQGRSIPRSRTGENEVLEGEVIDRGVPLGRPQPGPPPPPRAAKDPKQRKRTRRTVLWTLLGILVFVLLSGVGFGIIYYDKATKPNTDTPDAALEGFLDARFNGARPERVQQLICRSPNLGEFDELVKVLEASKAQPDEAIEAHASALDFKYPSKDKTEIETDLVLTSGPQNHASFAKERWHFDVVREDGWRVCGAHRLN
ncbi:hypothetical protein Dvina_03060 [Dactylosporangium vinaceum]|uniref:Uncharacterized protein n=1 Tax=Dactylosporangium vinaceum TaxID=53362 RepID=A0ABV5M136_9ACTN|nr:hypothetical protein [Dactylosporangium vinaceum]UAB97195.1 hypothetical protein Dvina_03060 [Dactylosporangium vinaceum]